MPVLYKEKVYAVDDDQNLHTFDIRQNIWNLLRWNQWKPNPLRYEKSNSPRTIGKVYYY